MKRAQRSWNKYNAKRTKTQHGMFDSKAESERFNDLVLLERAGEITALKRQVEFKLECNGNPICSYVADYTYRKDGVFVVEDCKGVITDIFRLKSKLFQANYGFPITIYKKLPARAAMGSINPQYVRPSLKGKKGFV